MRTLTAGTPAGASIELGVPAGVDPSDVYAPDDPRLRDMLTPEQFAHVQAMMAMSAETPVPEQGEAPQTSSRALPRAVVLCWRAGGSHFVRATAVQAIGGTAVAGLVFGVERLVSHLSMPGVALGTLAPAIALCALSVGVSGFAVATFPADQQYLADKVSSYAQEEIGSAAAKRPLIDFEKPEFFDRLQRAQAGAQVRPIQVSILLLALVSALASTIGIAGVAFSINPWFGLVAVLFVPLVLLGRRSSRDYRSLVFGLTSEERRRSYLASLLTRRAAAADIRAFGLAPSLLERYRRLSRERHEGLRGVLRRAHLRSVVSSTLLAAVTAGGVYFMSTLVADGRISLGQAAAAAGAAVLLVQRVQNFTQSLSQLYECALFLDDFFAFVDDAGVRAPSQGAPRLRRTLVELSDVTFHYPGRSESTLKSVDLRLQRGAVTALVGENGAGKSTIAKIVAGLYWPSSGTALRQPDASIAVLFQDFVTLEMSVRDNITIGTEANEARLVEAVRRSGFESVLARLPDGLDTLLGRSANDGIELSGGESQRLALARALYRDADVIILDEPTASLDPLAERAFYEDVLVARRAGTAVLLISHRLASVRHADEIVVLDHGEVRERGSHGDLMRTRGAYHRMFTTQASEFGVGPRTKNHVAPVKIVANGKGGPRSSSNGRSGSRHPGPTSRAPVEEPARSRRRETR